MAEMIQQFWIKLDLCCVVVASFLLAAFWFMSPLAFGFMPKPEDPAKFVQLQNLYWASYFIGIPAALLGPLAGIAAYALGRLRLRSSFLACHSAPSWRAS